MLDEEYTDIFKNIFWQRLWNVLLQRRTMYSNLTLNGIQSNQDVQYLYQFWLFVESAHSIVKIKKREVLLVYPLLSNLPFLWENNKVGGQADGWSKCHFGVSSFSF